MIPDPRIRLGAVEDFSDDTPDAFPMAHDGFASSRRRPVPVSFTPELHLVVSAATANFETARVELSVVGLPPDALRDHMRWLLDQLSTIHVPERRSGGSP